MPKAFHVAGYLLIDDVFFVTPCHAAFVVSCVSFASCFLSYALEFGSASNELKQPIHISLCFYILHIPLVPHIIVSSLQSNHILVAYIV